MLGIRTYTYNDEIEINLFRIEMGIDRIEIAIRKGLINVI